VRGLVEALIQSGRSGELVVHYTSLLARPTRNPALLVRLAEQLERGEWDKALPPALRRVQCLLQLAVHLYRTSTGDPVLTRARARLTDTFTADDPPLLRRMLEGADLEALRGFASMLEAGVDSALDRVFTRVAVELSADVFRGDERPFWESSGTWTYRSGLRKKQEELRVLTEEKIPANSEAIGIAASYGDLSENSEWEAAIEEQRNLTNRAMELEALILEAQLLENAAIPDGTVAPGTWVRYRDEAGKEHRLEIVGPWDIEHDGQVSYRSPLAAGMLGHNAGDRPSLELPSGEVEVEILETGPLARG
jgi:transcription elongation factor GreA